MITRRIKRTVLSTALLLALGAILTARIEAKPGFLDQAQELGYPAQDCTYCHIKATGGRGWNARGTWLRGQKRARRAKEVDVSWLKDYKQ